MTGMNPDHKLFSLYPQILVEIPFERALSSFILPLLGVTLNAKLVDITDRAILSTTGAISITQEFIDTDHNMKHRRRHRLK